MKESFATTLRLKSGETAPVGAPVDFVKDSTGDISVSTPSGVKKVVTEANINTILTTVGSGGVIKDWAALTPYTEDTVVRATVAVAAAGIEAGDILRRINAGTSGAALDSTEAAAWEELSTSVANNSVTYAKMQDVSATDKLLGRSTAGAGDVEEITCTPFARTLLDDANAAIARSTLGAYASFIYSGGTDANNLTAHGMHASTTGAGTLANAPAAFSGSGQWAVLASSIASGANTFIHQTFMTDNNDMYTRKRDNATTWTAWTKVLNGAVAQSEVTNLVADLAAKQATLVSGTNIKTVNGVTLLGSGDLVVSGSGVVDYVNVNQTTDQTTGLAATNPILFSTPVTQGSIPFSAGIFTLAAGKTYALSAGLTLITGTELIYQWRNITSATLIGSSGNSVTSVSGRGTVAMAVITPSVATTVKLEITSNSGVTAINSGLGRGAWATIQQIGSSAAINTILTNAQLDALNKITVSGKTRGIPTFTAPTTTGALGNYIASASSEFNSSFAAWTAGGIGVGDWATASVTTNFWIKYQLPTAKTVTEVRVAGRSNGTEMPSAGWLFQGSNDNTAWTTLHTGVAAMTTTNTAFTIASPAAYLYYRIFCPTGSGTNPGMSAFWLYENQYAFTVPI